MGGGGQEMDLTVENRLKAEVGDTVEVSISDKAMLKAVFLVYMVPVIGLIVGAFLGEYLAPRYGMDNAVMSPLLGLGLMGVAFVVVRVVGRRLGTLKEYLPRMVRIVKKDELA